MGLVVMVVGVGALEKTLMLGGIGGKRRRERQRQWTRGAVGRRNDPREKWLHNMSREIRSKGPGLPALPETPVSYGWGESSRENSLLKAPHRWNERALRGG